MHDESTTYLRMRGVDSLQIAVQQRNERQCVLVTIESQAVLLGACFEISCAYVLG